MVVKWLIALDRGELVGVILIAFRKAFDLVDHDILLRKLEIYKLNQNCLKWFRSYLSQRIQKCVFLEHFLSSKVCLIWSASRVHFRATFISSFYK